MSILEKLGFKKAEKIDIDSEIRKLKAARQEMERAVIEERDDMKRNIKRRELRGLEDKISLLEEKMRREGEKVPYP